MQCPFNKCLNFCLVSPLQALGEQERQQMNTWASKDKYKNIHLSHKNLRASGNGCGGSLRATYPIPPEIDQYFEVTIVAKAEYGYVAIGLTPAGSSLNT